MGFQSLSQTLSVSVSLCVMSYHYTVLLSFFFIMLLVSKGEEKKMSDVLKARPETSTHHFVEI